jgi:feruloyl esterase
MSISDCLLRLAAAVLFCASARAAATCESLAGLKLADTTITAAQAVSDGSFAPPTGQPMRNLPPFCRVAGVIKPSSDSHIEFEVWMPATGWNGKFQGIGNGGFAGVIGYRPLGAAITRGYAAASTDTGHRAAGGDVDASWALGHPQKVIDFGYRAIHEMTVKAKGILAAFYGNGPRRSYFASCSNGGRQALMEAQRYPADYDGIISGAPANYWTHLLSAAAVYVLATMENPASYIPASKLPAIEAAALAACDARDGLKDSIIDRPDSCGFDPGSLLCKGTETDNCLTAAQLTALKTFYAGPRTSKREAVFPGFPPGSETGPGGWQAWLTGSGPGKALLYSFSTQFFKHMVFEKPDWDWRTFNLERDVKTADAKLAQVLNATDPDLRKFRERGGKLILYHGWNDPAIAAGNTINYYESVVKRMGKNETGTFARLYMVPGMQHCGGGPGATVFDLAGPLERWVEEGAAPGQIIAKSTTGPRTRPLCAWPLVARYKGTGGIDDAANFECK